ncbi:MAG: hypothetical protein WBN22_04850 [Verrucomicrobiia bacterium]
MKINQIRKDGIAPIIQTPNKIARLKTIPKKAPTFSASESNGVKAERQITNKSPCDKASARSKRDEKITGCCQSYLSHPKI